MKLIQYTCALLMACSLVFVSQAEAKHAHEKTRSRILKEMSKNMTPKVPTVKKVKA